MRWDIRLIDGLNSFVKGHQSCDKEGQPPPSQSQQAPADRAEGHQGLAARQPGQVLWRLHGPHLPSAGHWVLPQRISAGQKLINDETQLQLHFMKPERNIKFVLFCWMSSKHMKTKYCSERQSFCTIMNKTNLWWKKKTRLTVGRVKPFTWLTQDIVPMML